MTIIGKILKIILGLIAIICSIMLVAYIILLLGIFVAPSTGKDTFKEDYPVSESKARVCILYYDTEFKKKLVTALVEDLNEKHVSVVVDRISNRDSYNPLDYDALILLAGVMRFSPLPEATQFIRKNNYAYNIVYFVAYEGVSVPYGLQLDKKKIDAVTSASAVDDNDIFEDTKNRIIARTMDILLKY